ncbi:hypothetical protein G6F70_000434 [Rhizopus microsporus]|uniref:BRISC and BRCA1-A complex member 1 n=2 Tax=Rhizopus TaxID=4842 RepID=A0A367JZE6_RHIAZ|nr:hypothetical protein G6F70_000434 [Rhizopus microsporus]KAG1215839.1 hypothetical protein G6F69_000650 [Rhizopus microsporus]ORE23233.1 hypothetical protein BCV71DRAFT_230636 [Rhizopus microsporus]RCH95313.1 hypothetical protein CU097_005047 [Rhizopus azygosporus]CEI99078.1 hypothetical protein RMCBS344292_13172 [Rhizopus microsporus]
MSNKQTFIDLDETDSLLLKKAIPRQIIFCVDVSKEMNSPLSASIDGGLNNTNLKTSTRLETIIRFIKRYILMNKLIGNKNDKYAFILLKEKSEWWKPFTLDEQEACSYVDMLDEQIDSTSYDSFQLESLFRDISVNANLDDKSTFTQAIVIYSRTRVIPKRSLNDEWCIQVRHLSNFTLDVIYLHDLDDQAQLVYDAWNDLDSDQVPGWYYEVVKVLGQDNVSKALCQLLAHPLQRGKQEGIVNVI